MKIALLGPASSGHISKISNELLKCNIDNIVISLPNHRDEQKRIKGKVFYLKHSGEKGYYLNMPQVKKILKKEHCDVLNAHYASGYGTLATGVHFPRTVISVWGSDVYSFPYQSKLHRHILVHVLSHSELIFSTSECMKKQTAQFLKKPKKIIVTPLGIDFDLFPFSKPKRHEKSFTIGFLKGTDALYGYDVFLKALRKLIDSCKASKIKIFAHMCGDSYNQTAFFDLVDRLKLREYIDYSGTIPHKDMPEFIQQCDVVCIPSRKESFGVVAIEAMACGRPCVTSDAEGLQEVMVDGITGYVFENENVDACALQLEHMLKCPDSILKMGYNARKHVEQHYNFSNNINQFISGYESLVVHRKGK